MTCPKSVTDNRRPDDAPRCRSVRPMARDAPVGHTRHACLRYMPARRLPPPACTCAMPAKPPSPRCTSVAHAHSLACCPDSPPTHRPHAPQNSDFSNATTKVCARPLATAWLPRSHRAIRTLWQREQWPTTSSRRCTPSRVAATCRRARSLLVATTLSKALP